jgi:hypothetical protein
MSESQDKGPNAYAAYMVVALVSALAAVFIPFIALKTLSQISDGGMWAIALMSLAPCLLGIGVSYFIHHTSRHGPGGTTPS